MKRKLIFMLILVAMACLFTLSVSAAPEKPTLAVDFGAVQEISGFTPPSQKFVNTDERVVLFDGENYITYPTYYIMADATTFSDSFNFKALNDATGKGYSFTSVILVELPEGITGLSYRAFKSCTSCIYIKVPSSLESCDFGAFSWNSSFQVIEFMDGTTPIDSTKFGTEVFSNCTALKYIRLPNNLISTGDKLFYKCTSLETVVLGASFGTLATRGTNFQYTTSSQMINIYISTAFGSNGLNNNMFTWNSTATKDESAKIVFHYAGTQSQAQSLQNLALGTSNNGKISYATILSKDELATTTLDPNKNYIVYGYEACDVFYDGHDYKGDGDCTHGLTCTQCNDNLAGFADHVYSETLVYPNGFKADGVYNKHCTNASDCIFGLVENEKADPIFTALADNGYSVNAYGTGIAFGGFAVNTTELKKYNDLNENDITFGILVANPKYVGDTFMANGEVNATSGFLKVDMTSDEYTNIKIMLDGFTGSAQELELVISLYAYTDVNDVQFIQSEHTACANSKVVKADATLYTVTLNSVVNKINDGKIDALPEYGKKENE